MGTPLIDMPATILCPHGGKITFSPSNSRVRAGAFLLVISDLGMVAGCPFATTSPQPCLTAQFLQPATRVRIMGQPAILATASGLCQGAGPPGPPLVAQTQVRVRGL